MAFLWFAILGLVVGAYGTLIGVGGGFLLVPVLLWLYPYESPDIIASISLAVVFFNAASGSFAYARMGRVEFKSGFMFAAAALPGTVLGALSTSYLPRGTFDVIIGSLLIVASVFLLVRPQNDEHKQPASGGRMKVVLTDASGETHIFSYHPWIGIGLSFAVGYLSSILGIGGGIIHVPALVHLLNFPVHIATATSHFILALMAFSGSMTHLLEGTLTEGFGRIIPLAIGVVIGAQIGARISTRIHGKWIIRGLAVALLFVGLRTMWVVFR